MRAGRVAAVCGLLVVAACGGSSPESTEPDLVKVAVSPGQSEDRLREQYEPLLAHLEDAAGIEAELLIPESYANLLDAFGAGDVDLAWFGGLTFLQAERDFDARPLVLRDVDLEFTSDFIVAADAPGETIDDFAGAGFTFGPELSTSGHLMPRFHLMESGTDPEAVFGSVGHTDGHDETARLVRDGEVAIGAVNSVVMEALFEEGAVTADQVRILERTSPYRNYVWATQPGMSDDLRIRLLDGFLALDPAESEDGDTLDRLGAGGFLPATVTDFEELRAAAEMVGLLDGAER